MANENQSKFYFIAHFLNREFVGQKALNEDNEKVISGETVEEFVDGLWHSALPFIKREVTLDGDNFAWAPSEKPTRTEIEQFVTLQDQGRKAIPMTQVDVDCLRKLRGKHINVHVYSYGKKICNKSIHTKFSAQLLIPEKRDRANADNTVSLMEMVGQLKAIHSVHYAGHHSSWVMWANYIQSAPLNESRDRLLNECPPAHLIRLFRAVPFSDNEKMQSARNGLQVTDNMIDAFKLQLELLTKDFDTMRQSIARCLEMMEWRLKSLENVITSNQRLVSAMTNSLQPEENETSRQQESLIMDCEDVDHVV